MTSGEDIDNVISAELPPDPESFPPGTKQEQAKRLEKIILQNMVHGPCGKENPTPNIRDLILLRVVEQWWSPPRIKISSLTTVGLYPILPFSP